MAKATLTMKVTAADGVVVGDIGKNFSSGI
jgi:hypothetical protein